MLYFVWHCGHYMCACVCLCVWIHVIISNLYCRLFHSSEQKQFFAFYIHFYKHQNFFPICKHCLCHCPQIKGTREETNKKTKSKAQHKVIYDGWWWWWWCYMVWSQQLQHYQITATLYCGRNSIYIRICVFIFNKFSNMTEWQYCRAEYRTHSYSESDKTHRERKK